MEIKLQNEICEVLFSLRGAELCSFKFKGEENQYIWDANPNVWGWHAPTLFPIISGMKDNEYIVNGKTYTLQSHGFTRWSTFEVITQTETSVTFRLRKELLEEKFKDTYPYDFHLDITYILENSTLIKTHTVTNLSSSEVMLFEVGGHDAFSTTVETGETMDDYYLDFGDNIDKLTALKLHPQTGFVTRETREHTLVGGKLDVPMEFFSGDTLIIQNPTFKTVSLKSRASSRSITVEFPDFDVIAFWSKYVEGGQSNYVCIEPWTSLPDCDYLSKELSEKVGIQSLSPLESKDYTIKTTFNK